MAFFVIITSQLRAEASRLDPDDGIASGIERRTFTEDLDADDEFFQLLAPAGHRFVNGEGKKALEAVGLAEGLAGEDSVQLRDYLLVGILADFEAWLRGRISYRHSSYCMSKKLVQRNCGKLPRQATVRHVV